jgi:hypothetical protein
MRGNRPRIGRIAIARGRDAADVAISTTFGSAALTRFAVVTEEVVEEGSASYRRRQSSYRPSAMEQLEVG